jgi:hypothetical protein
MKTDIDLSTAAASRVSLADTENNRADQAIRFSDGKGDNYICYLDSPTLQSKSFDHPQQSQAQALNGFFG